MNSQELYLNISQIISNQETGLEWPSDYDREAVVHVSRASNENQISHITLEFAGVRAKFFSCIMFDGSGDHGVGVHSFAMPKLKLTLPQKALAALSVLQYLIDQNMINANFKFYREKICAELNGGVGHTLTKYDLICKASRDYLERKGATTRVPMMIAG
jgi:hypothetical protein